MTKKNVILVAPLNWGLGHATRCIPLIQKLLVEGYDVLIASDGASLLLLKMEFPELPTIELPSYKIFYPKNGKLFKWKLLFKLPHIKKAIKQEKEIVAELVESGKIDGILSDNRFGVINSKVPSVFITHQLNVLTGSTSYFSSRIHQKIMKKFDECWVPDVEDIVLNLSGKLGHLKYNRFPVKHIGVLSRMKKIDLPKKYDILIILSGPEPHRTMLELKLLEEFKKSTKSILLVQGVIRVQQEWKKAGNIDIVNFMKSDELEVAINESDVIISRSGYTTIMDLTMLEKKAFFIPTPGQYEQEYLAKRLRDLGIVPSCEQDKFNEGKLDKVITYKGLKTISHQPDLNGLFSLFQSKRELGPNA